MQQTRKGRKKAILDCAWRLIYEQGYANVTLDTIAAEVGCSKSTIYKFFKNKEDLLISVFENVVTKSSEILEDPIHSSLSVEEVIYQYAVLNMQATHTSQHIAILRTVFAELRHSPSLGIYYYKSGPGKAIATFADYLRRQTEMGALKVDDPKTVAAQFIGSFHWGAIYGGIFGAGNGQSDEDIVNEAKRAVRVFLKTYGK